MSEAARARWIRLVLAVGVFVTLGTSALHPPSREEDLSREVLPGDRFVLRVWAHQDAVRAHGSYGVSLHASGERCAQAVLRFVPRDPASATLQLVLDARTPVVSPDAGLDLPWDASASLLLDAAVSNGASAGGLEDDAGLDLPPVDEPCGNLAARHLPDSSSQLTIDTYLCPVDALCERVYDVERIDGPLDSGEAIQLTVEAKISEQDDGGGCASPPKPSFGKDAAIGISIDE